MKKIVPDPPEALDVSLLCDQYSEPNQSDISAFTSNQHPSTASQDDEAFFEARQGISHEDALVHASELLKCAAATTYETADNLTGEQRALAFSAYHLIGMAKTLVDSSVDRINT